MWRQIRLATDRHWLKGREGARRRRIGCERQREMVARRARRGDAAGQARVLVQGEMEVGECFVRAD